MKFIKKLKELFRKKEERPIVLDTCALETKQVMEIIEKAQKVILLTSILEEMDNHKMDKKELGYNVRKILRESRQDKNSEKYVCVAGYEKYKYNDKNIIDYCIKHRKTIIVTSDNYVCNIAKAYRLEYIFIEREEEKKKVTKVKKKEKQNILRQNIKRVQYEEGRLYLNINMMKEYKFFLYRKNILQITDSIDKKELKVGDNIFMLHKKSEDLIIQEYEIVNLQEAGYAICKNKVCIDLSKDSNVENNFPEEIKKYILENINENSKEIEMQREEENKIEEKKETLEIMTEQKEKDANQQVEKEGKSEIHFYKNWIRVNRNKEYHIKELVIRENKLIPIQDYQQGDYLFVLKYNINKKYIEIFVYEIEFENDNYTPKEMDKQRIYYINEIYKLDFSEEIENAIWKFYISNTGY